MTIEHGKISREELQLQAEQMMEAQRLQHEALLFKDEDLIDSDGYPTDYALHVVEQWPWHIPGWFKFIKIIWWMPSWGWTEGEEPSEHYKDKKVYRYNISTGGWSGNESIIKAMQKNDFHWYLVWVQSRRGGHYIFEEREIHNS